MLSEDHDSNSCEVQVHLACIGIANLLICHNSKTRALFGTLPHMTCNKSNLDGVNYKHGGVCFQVLLKNILQGMNLHYTIYLNYSLRHAPSYEISHKLLYVCVLAINTKLIVLISEGGPIVHVA